MQFCPKCGILLVQKIKRLSCPKCGHVSKEKQKISTSEKIGEKTRIDVLHEKDSSVWPVTAMICPKCGNKEAYFWSAQMRAADEGETRFFRCTKCRHTWREYK